MAAGASLAQVDLRWSPSDTTRVVSGASTRLAINLDEAINFRTIEVVVSYDTTVVRSLGGGPGAMFADSGFQLFEDFEEVPGRWHAYAVILGAGDFLTGPGELLYWDFEGIAMGESPLLSVETILFDEVSPPNLIEDVQLSSGVIIVESPLSAVGDSFSIPTAPTQLLVAPNPFNPKTRISFDVAQETSGRLSVFDMRGHQIAVLHNGLIPAGLLAKDWNGTDDFGKKQPGGVYLFCLETPNETARAKGILVK